MNIEPEKLAKQAQIILKSDIPQLLTCGGVFTFCTLANIAQVMQQVGVIFGGVGAVVIVLHRVWAFLKEVRS